MQQANRSWQGLNGAGEREEAGGGVGETAQVHLRSRILPKARQFLRKGVPHRGLATAMVNQPTSFWGSVESQG